MGGLRSLSVSGPELEEEARIELARGSSPTSPVFKTGALPLGHSSLKVSNKFPIRGPEVFNLAAGVGIKPTTPRRVPPASNRLDVSALSNPPMTHIRATNLLIDSCTSQTGGTRSTRNSLPRERTRFQRGPSACSVHVPIWRRVPGSNRLSPKAVRFSKPLHYRPAHSPNLWCPRWASNPHTPTLKEGGFANLPTRALLQKWCTEKDSNLRGP